MTALLSVQGLRVEIAARHRVLTAIDDVSFDIAEGEILGVVGESGAGKSVTGTAVLGLLERPAYQAGGRIIFAGRRIDTLDEDAMRTLRSRQIAAVFQDPLTSLDPLMTIGDQLVETMQTHLDLARAAALARAEQLLAEVGIPAPRERLQSYPHEMSGGMRQRVVLALAFCCEPRLIIADEPTTALDVSIQAQILDLLRRMCRERGTAVMLVTHDMGVIAEASDRVAVMYAGRLVEIGPTRDLIAAAAHPYTRGLMASIPDMHRRAAELTQIPGSMPRPDAPVPGCAFHPRCPQALARCATDRPAMLPQGASQVACWLVDAASRSAA
ncbi:ABC transporter ATP-binding protein [Bosea sp. 117]|uniref:ABC transporter ATP-binding protein n=1 Tax=Bosea sp. 117 TaxID=1125973 RepID=UPI0004949547|nr:ABC transporter ATP-binding protein [Bosea sp. 117]